MAIAVDNSANLGSTSGSSLTASFTVGTGSNRLLIVYVDEAQPAMGVKVTGVTYAGTAMTQMTGSPMNNQGRYWHTYYLLNPTSGANNVVVSADAGGDYVQAQAVSYTGVKQTSNPESVTTASPGSVTSISASLTPTTANSWIMGAVRGPGSPVTATGSATIRLNPIGVIVSLDTNGGVSGSTTLGLSWTSPSTTAGMMIMSFAPSSDAASATVTPTLMMMNVG